ncbi:extracellular solute-binding protein [Streptomyces canus]|uniref:extracellular solute-binding protein n=1 Tax=Streptomyces canus TaxID=58343 RepID=UPI0036F02411
MWPAARGRGLTSGFFAGGGARLSSATGLPAERDRPRVISPHRPPRAEEPPGTFILKALPATDDPSQTLIPAAAGAGYGVNAKAKNPELALRFVNFVMSPEGMNLFVKKQGGLPSLPDTGFAVDPSLTELSRFIRANRTVPFMDQRWPNAKVQQTMLSGLQEIFSGQSTLRSLLKDMDSDYQAGS